jgi:hypothetical protein
VVGFCVAWRNLKVRWLPHKQSAGVSSEHGRLLNAGLLRCVIWCRFINVSNVEAASTSETSVNFCHAARRRNPGDSHLHSRCCQNLKPHGIYSICHFFFLSITLTFSVLFRLLDSATNTAYRVSFPHWLAERYVKTCHNNKLCTNFT